MTATTTSDNFCFGLTDLNVNHEFGHWEGDGIAGRFLGHHFSGDFDETVDVVLAGRATSVTWLKGGVT